ncbi:hypothetical protein BB561_004255 [Smittium simulii]|uniref:Nuclear pore complex protein Nup85 n=1 Tax=Smittium simulii TaxID=133385 RepID=A0A2T9YH93_9FUNG|nr:hypothetical protein BB561_004255 [Smittium simulii]
MSLQLYDLQPLRNKVFSCSNVGSISLHNASEQYTQLESRLSDQNFRAFFVRTHCLFKNIQTLSSVIIPSPNSTSEAEYNTAFQNISSLYQEAILTQYQTLSDLQQPYNSKYTADLPLLQSIYTLWNLLDITYFDNFHGDFSPTKGLKYALIFSKWYRFNFPLKAQLDDKTMLQKALIRGDIKLAQQLLVSLNTFDHPQIKNIINGLLYLLSEHPAYDLSNKLKFQKYRQNILLFNGNLPILSSEFDWLISASKIVCGDNTVLLDTCDNFLEYQCAVLLFGFVKSTKFDLAQISFSCFEALGDPESESDFIHCVASLLQSDFAQFFVYLSKIDLWLCAHLTDFCFKAKIVNKDDLAALEVDPRCYFLIMYSSGLCGVPHYWRISLDYYTACGTEGLAMSEQVILRQPKDSLKKLLKLVGTCKSYGLEHIIDCLYRTAGAEFLGNSHYSKAIYCYWKVSDFDMIEYVAALILNKYLCTGKIEILEETRNLQTYMIERVPTLLSIYQYLQLLKLIQKQDFKRIQSQISEFFTKNKKPNVVWPIVLIDIVTLLGNDSNREGLGAHSMLVAKSCELVMSSPFKSDLYNPIIKSKGDGINSTLISQLNSVQEIDKAIKLLVYNPSTVLISIEQLVKYKNTDPSTVLISIEQLVKYKNTDPSTVLISIEQLVKYKNTDPSTVLISIEQLVKYKNTDPSTVLISIEQLVKYKNTDPSTVLISIEQLVKYKNTDPSTVLISIEQLVKYKNTDPSTVLIRI